MGGRFICRRCHFHGDAATYLMEMRGMSFPEACAELGIDPGPAPGGKHQLSVVKPVWRPAEPGVAPGEKWQAQAGVFLLSCQKALQANERALAWLQEKRGLTAEVAKAAGLGLNTKDQRFDRAAWGLREAPVRSVAGKTRQVWLPAGLVIPWRDRGGQLIRLRIRRNDPGDGSRYIVAAGSCMDPMILWKKQAAVVIVESELDALLIHQDANDLVGVVAMGSAQKKPDRYLHRCLEAASRMLVALDSDEAGKRAAWHFWQEAFPFGFERWPVIRGKDPNEQRLMGVPVRLWIEAALTPEPSDADRAKPATVHKGQPTAMDLPAECPLRTRGPVPPGCRFHPRLFDRLLAEGTLPMPGGGCPLLKVCRLREGRNDG